jgi:hypothetical protein
VGKKNWTKFMRGIWRQYWSHLRFAYTGKSSGGMGPW